MTDQYTAGVAGSGFLPLVANSIQGSPSESVAVNTNAAANAVSVGVFATAAPGNPTPGCDLAGNCVTVSTGPYNLDLQPPTITGPTFSSAGPLLCERPSGHSDVYLRGRFGFGSSKLHGKRAHCERRHAQHVDARVTLLLR